MHHISFVPESNCLLTVFNAHIAKFCCQILRAPELKKFFEIVTLRFMGIGKIVHHRSVRNFEEGLYFRANMILPQIFLKSAYALSLQNDLLEDLDHHPILDNWGC